MASNNFPTPAPLEMTGDLAHNWSFFRSQYENYEIATGLVKKDEAILVATLLSVVGKECFRVLNNSKWQMTTDRKSKRFSQPCRHILNRAEISFTNVSSLTPVSKAKVKQSRSILRSFDSWHQSVSLALLRTT